MASKKKKNKKTIIKSAPAPVQDKPQDSKWASRKYHLIGVFSFAFLLFANTLGHDYTQDDAIVIYDNMYTTQGVQGIPGLLSKDTFFGFFKVEGKDKLVTGGRYRPLTPIMFALEWQFFGSNPFVGHLISIILFGLLCVVLYKTLELVFLNKVNPKLSRTLILITVLIFAAHPIHTEVVANIKGRDEIMTMMGALIAVYASFRHYHSKKIIWFLLVVASFFLALMSKENAITFLAVVPVAYLLFRKLSLGKALSRLFPFLLATILFLGVRTAVLGLDFGGTPMELMNNPFIKAVNNEYVPFSFGEKAATISYTLGKYLQLLVFPHPLTHDYYPRHIDIMSFSNLWVLLSVLLYIGLLVSIFYFWKRNKLISFSAFYFIATLSIVSNIVFPIGTNMSERFAFMPSLGFALVAGYLFSKLMASEKWKLLGMGLLAVVLIAFSAKTFSRNMVWKDDYTLFTTDVHTSSRSAKVLNAAGGAISTSVYTAPEGEEKTRKLNKAIGYLKEAVRIHPTYKNAYLLLGNSYYYLKDYDKAIQHYDQALVFDPSYSEAYKNLGISLRDAGRHYGEKMNDFAKASQYLKRSYSINPTDYETLRLLGITSGLQGNHKDAIKYFEEALKINPNVPQLYASLGTAYLNYGDEESARMYFQKAEQMDPKVFNRLGQQ